MAKKSAAKSSAADKKVRRVRNGIVIGLALLVGLVVGYGVLYSTGATDSLSGDGYSEGSHYELIDGVEPRRKGSTVVVTEYFSYGCIHCKNFDPLVKAFEPTLPEGARLEQVPVTFSQSWALLARSYLALAELDGLTTNHERLFKAIHDSKRQFRSVDDIATFVNGNDGVTTSKFIEAFNSSAVRRRLSKIDASSRTVGISAVPTLIVDDRYRINTADVGRKQSLEVARFLVDKILSEEAASTTAPAAGG